MEKVIITAVIIGLFVSPIASMANDQLHKRPRYTLHTGDVISLDYRYTPEFNQSVTVQPDGYVTLNIVGDIKATNVTLDDLHDEIVRSASIRLNHPELSISLKQFQPPYIVVAGEVDKPGKIEIHQDTSALQAIMLAGGFKDSALDTRVILFRHVNEQMAEVRQLDLHNIKKTGDLERDAALEPGDMLLVTRNKTEHFARFMKAANLGTFFDPTTSP
jgi:polysaccharide export outer membrane protein